jgi:hypothetical protein
MGPLDPRRIIGECANCAPPSGTIEEREKKGAGGGTKFCPCESCSGNYRSALSRPCLTGARLEGERHAVPHRHWLYSAGSLPMPRSIRVAWFRKRARRARRIGRHDGLLSKHRPMSASRAERRFASRRRRDDGLLPFPRTGGSRPAAPIIERGIAHTIWERPWSPRLINAQMTPRRWSRSYGAPIRRARWQRRSRHP